MKTFKITKDAKLAISEADKKSHTIFGYKKNSNVKSCSKESLGGKTVEAEFEGDGIMIHRILDGDSK